MACRSQPLPRPPGQEDCLPPAISQIHACMHRVLTLIIPDFERWRRDSRLSWSCSHFRWLAWSGARLPKQIHASPCAASTDSSSRTATGCAACIINRSVEKCDRRSHGGTSWRRMSAKCSLSATTSQYAARLSCFLRPYTNDRNHSSSCTSLMCMDLTSIPHPMCDAIVGRFIHVR